MRLRTLPLLIFLLTACGGSLQKNRIVVASKNFTEQFILGELLAQHLENRLQIPVERRLNLGGTFICDQALRSGKIDLYVEYTGTAYTGILQRPPIHDPQKVLEEIRKEYVRAGLVWTKPLGFNNTFALIIRGEEARQWKLKTISQTVTQAKKWRAGFGYEFMERADGWKGLAQTYGLQLLESPRIMDLGLTYRALAEKKIDLIAGDSTSGLVATLDLFVLEDDRHYFPPYHAAPVVRQAALDAHRGLREALEELGGRISAEEMRELNRRVDVEKRDVRQVVSEYLQAQGLL